MRDSASILDKSSIEGVSSEKKEENGKGDHHAEMLQRLHPYLLQDSDMPHHLHECPESHDSGYSHAYVGSPRRDTRLLYEYEHRADKASESDYKRHGMCVAEKLSVVAEHQKHIARPEHQV